MSSSGHVALVPRLLGWEYDGLPPDTRKTFEVALHAGSAPAVALALRGTRSCAPLLLGLTLLPPALAGALLERPIEQRLGGPRSVAVAQIVAGAALLLADGRPERRDSPTAADHVAVGCAQAAALVPGVSRSGAALTVARLRGLSRTAAADLSLQAALPVTVGAGVLKGLRAARDGVPAELRRPAALGAGAACASGLAALPLARGTRWRGLAAYRIGLGALALGLLARRPNRT